MSGETLYYNQWWTETEDSGSFRRAKHIYVGQERIVTRLSNPAIGGSPYEDVNTYYYHPDHLGSAHSITDSEGNPYERIEYTPYGEMWIEIQEDDATESYNYIPFRFTGKEYDEETGLYYYGARYLDPKTSRWVSGDPAGFGLMNPMDNEGKPRQGYSIVEATNWYSYVSNNPVKYVDPTGMDGELFFSRGVYTNSSSLVTMFPRGNKPVPDIAAFVVSQDVVVFVGAVNPLELNVTITNTDAIFTEYDVDVISMISLKVNGSTLYSGTAEHVGALNLILPVGKVVIGGAFMDVPLGTEDQRISIDVDSTYVINQDPGLWSPGTLETVVELPPDFMKDE